VGSKQISFTVRGSIYGRGESRKGGSWTYVKERTDKVEQFQKRIRREAVLALRGGPREIRGPIFMEIVVLRVRPKRHFRQKNGQRTKYVRPSAPKVPMKKPNTLDVAEVVQDALCGLAYDKKKQVVHVNALTEYSEQGEEAVFVSLLPLTEQDGEEGVNGR
jgi:hypothetical protein